MSGGAQAGRRPRVSMIAAVAENGVIGVDNDLPWSLRDDMLHFMRTTKGHAVVMGRKTYESMGQPLPNRRNVVLTRDSAWRADGVEVCSGVDEALSLLKDEGVVYVIGGGAVYGACMGRADELIITHVDAAPEGHAYFPEIDAAAWRVVRREAHAADERNEHAFEVRWYERV